MRQSHAKLGSGTFLEIWPAWRASQGCVHTPGKAFHFTLLLTAFVLMCLVSDALIKINSVHLCMGVWKRKKEVTDFKPIGPVIVRPMWNMRPVDCSIVLFKHLSSAKFHIECMTQNAWIHKGRQNDPMDFFFFYIINYNCNKISIYNKII